MTLDPAVAGGFSGRYDLTTTENANLRDGSFTFYLRDEGHIDLDFSFYTDRKVVMERHGLLERVWDHMDFYNSDNDVWHLEQAEEPTTSRTDTYDAAFWGVELTNYVEED